jgi:hypothetical protein
MNEVVRIVQDPQPDPMGTAYLVQHREVERTGGFAPSYVFP